MKTEIEPLETYREDKPCFNWETFQGTPARSWRSQPEPKFIPSEAAKFYCGMIGLGMLIFSAALLITFFCR